MAAHTVDGSEHLFEIRDIGTNTEGGASGMFDF
jgi:hypothetical protein